MSDMHPTLPPAQMSEVATIVAALGRCLAESARLRDLTTTLGTGLEGVEGVEGVEVVVQRQGHVTPFHHGRRRGVAVRRTLRSPGLARGHVLCVWAVDPPEPIEPVVDALVPWVTTAFDAAVAYQSALQRGGRRRLLSPSRPRLAAPRPGDVAACWAARLGMTPRQQEIVLLVVAGESNRVIAERLGVAEVTVEKHLQAIFRRSGVVSRATLVSRALGRS